MEKFVKGRKYLERKKGCGIKRSSVSEEELK
jgi:hypothetical protein